MQQKFSVALIAKNEAKTLPRLMASLKQFQAEGGEVLLLDTGSTDNTPQIARELGCVVHEVGEKFIITLDAETAKNINEKFIVGLDPKIVKEGDRMFDYSSARNYIAEFAKNDMIATPDCDEMYTQLDLEAVNKMIDEGVDQFEYNFVYAHDAEGNEVIKFKHSKFYNRKKLSWVGVIHEVLQAKEKVNTKFVEENIIKLEHWQNPSTDRKHYLTGLAYDCYKNPLNDRNAHYFGRELFYRGHMESAIEQLKTHANMQNAWKAERAQSMIYIGDAYISLDDFTQAVKWYAYSFDLDPTRREALMKLAEHYYKLGSADHVIAYTAAALQIKGNNEFYGNYQPYYENMPHELMYWALWQKGELAASRDHFDLCFAYQPFNSKYLHDFRFYYNLPKISFILPTVNNRPDGLKRALASIEKLNYPQEKIEILVLDDSERIGVPKRVKEGVEKSTGDWIVYASDDTEFDPDSIMSAFKTAMDNRKYFMAFNTGEIYPDEGNICEHFMIHKKLIPKLGGEIFDTDFNHVGVDNLLWAKLKRMGQNMRCERAVVRHYHFSRTGEEMDATYQIGWNSESVRKDRELLAVKLEQLNNSINNNESGSQEKFNG